MEINGNSNKESHDSPVNLGVFPCSDNPTGQIVKPNSMHLQRIKHVSASWLIGSSLYSMIFHISCLYLQYTYIIKNIMECHHQKPIIIMNIPRTSMIFNHISFTSRRSDRPKAQCPTPEWLPPSPAASFGGECFGTLNMGYSCLSIVMNGYYSWLWMMVTDGYE